MKAHFEMFAAYNAWANRRLYAAAAGLPEAARNAPAGAFFGSLHATLNHLLVADRIWMRRFTGEGETHERLDEVPFDGFAALREARGAMDARIENYVTGLSEAGIAADFSYVRVTAPEPITQKLAPALAHFFNHQTHHRGQCHQMLTAAGATAPPLDLLFFQREAA
ncbi:damage-inducible protein DinB [Pikeienuella piscinae]|uniref:Damage-inducible protein DinB n=1 Tax=Pikeienuella piscinae TaxID=2748098 RepID=A0A7L5BYQ8_9RHOB|nr:DinB family protein [Pikeienuella piscinae]QIE55376.1 damage-inducible protein DinB [Pikeienuella piscinae]